MSGKTDDATINGWDAASDNVRTAPKVHSEALRRGPARLARPTGI